MAFPKISRIIVYTHPLLTDAGRHGHDLPLSADQPTRRHSGGPMVTIRPPSGWTWRGYRRALRRFVAERPKNTRPPADLSPVVVYDGFPLDVRICDPLVDWWEWEQSAAQH